MYISRQGTNARHAACDWDPTTPRVHRSRLKQLALRTQLIVGHAEAVQGLQQAGKCTAGFSKQRQSEQVFHMGLASPPSARITHLHMHTWMQCPPATAHLPPALLPLLCRFMPLAAPAHDAQRVHHTCPAAALRVLVVQCTLCRQRMARER